MTLNDFLNQYQDTKTELEECRERLLELAYPQRGNKITSGEHAGISNQPEEYAIIKDQLERKVYHLEKSLPHKRKQIERFLNRIKPRQARVLRKKYIDGLDNGQLASWMNIQYKSAIAVIRLALEHAQLEYDKITQEQKNTPE
jgi:DNA-directed RNA polymerase specialized sigma24 family protein